MLPAPTVDGDAVDRAVEDVLTRPRFVNARPGWLAELRDRVSDWIMQRLQDLFGSDAAPVIAWVVVAAVLAFAVLVVVLMLRRTRIGRQVESRPPVSVAVTRSPQEWLDEARAAREAGERAEAVRGAYRAVVAMLAARGVVEEVPGRTVGEYRAQVAARDPQRVGAFSQASDVFEQVWYAQRTPSDDEVDRVLGVAQQMAGVR